MPDTTTALPVIGSRCWRVLISPESGATVLSLAPESLNAGQTVELAYDERGSGWWLLSTLIF
jgi:hypothetical protein